MMLEYLPDGILTEMRWLAFEHTLGAYVTSYSVIVYDGLGLSIQVYRVSDKIRFKAHSGLHQIVSQIQDNQVYRVHGTVRQMLFLLERLSKEYV